MPESSGGITITGIDELMTKLDKVSSDSVLRPPMQRAVYRLQSDMADYPPQRTHSRTRRVSTDGTRVNRNTYRRTGTLGRTWTTQVNSTLGGIQGKVGNNTDYAPWVQSEQWQAWMHRGTWQTDQEVMDKNRGAIIEFFRTAINRALGG